MNVAQMKLLFGKVLGEIYRLQKEIDAKVPVKDSQIYGLIHGIEEAIDEEMTKTLLTTAQSEFLTDIMQSLDQGERKITGYYAIEQELKANGIDRSTAILFFTYLRGQGRFGEEAWKQFNTGQSPSECRNFDFSKHLFNF